MTDTRRRLAGLLPGDGTVPAFGLCALCLAGMVPLSLGTLSGAVDEAALGYAVPVLVVALGLAAATLHGASME